MAAASVGRDRHCLPVGRVRRTFLAKKWTSAVSNAGVVAAGWPNAALDNKPDKRMVMAHGCFIIRSPEPRRAFGRARGQVVSTIDHHTAAFRRFLLLPEETQLAEKHGPYDPIAPFDPPFCPAARCNSLRWQRVVR